MYIYIYITHNIYTYIHKYIYTQGWYNICIYIICIIFTYMETTMIAQISNVLHMKYRQLKEWVENFFVTFKYFRLIMQFLQAIKKTN